MLCQLKSGLYCYLVPTNYDGTDLMTKMWVEAVLPEGDIHYAEAVKEMYKRGVEEIRGEGGQKVLLLILDLMSPTLATSSHSMVHGSKSTLCSQMSMKSHQTEASKDTNLLLLQRWCSNQMM